MPEIKLFSLEGNVEEIKTVPVDVDLELQGLVEDNMKKFFGVTFVASDYDIGQSTISSVGLDENRVPVVFVYNTKEEQNLLSKGLFHIEQLLANKDRFYTSVSSKLGKKASDVIDWTMPRIICISSGYSKYDRSAVNQFARNISLIQYAKYGNGIITFELLESNSTKPLEEPSKVRNGFAANLKKANTTTKDFYERLCEYVKYFDEVVTVNRLRTYIAFKKIKNFGALRIEDNKIIINVNLDPTEFAGREGFKDVSFATHFSTGQLQYTFSNEEGLKVAKHLLLRSYNEN